MGTSSLNERNGRTWIDADAARRAAESVADPCGLLYGNGMTFGDLGMVESVHVEDSTVVVQLLLDDPNCLYMPQIMTDIESAVAEIPGVDEVVIRNRRDAIWSRDLMTIGGRKKMDDHRRRKEEKLERLREQLARDASHEAIQSR